MIQIANSDAERQEVLGLFLDIFDDIAPNAVPMTAHDDLYKPLVIQFRSDTTQQLLGAALSCRAQVAAGSALMAKSGAQLPSENDYAPVLDKHSELDLIGVRPEAREQGIGSQMLAFLETTLASRGVRVWFGNVTDDLEADRLRPFYRRHGFTVLDDGQPLPPLLGRRWVSPATAQPAYFFYKKL
ncbi:GNAT family N-acetyltransferase [[Mycobacterium] crassicus]|uniref:GNAT family N-acetyltransferase n=1 Tax=[Mycobacterium] crassicus TaxID=2872309 RepID=A0ABU5XDI9_9MYCO|nr:GNAT family N-acetyltransferase [Mycolicibacter sp. MYC098]MEB3020385.1 GNAT family N-acetyltransferase [Mycolicibacter sp. MYC098]